MLRPLAADRYWLPIADSDMLLWVRAMTAERAYIVIVSEPDVSPLAVQVPPAGTVLKRLCSAGAQVKYFCFQETEI